MAERSTTSSRGWQIVLALAVLGVIAYFVFGRSGRDAVAIHVATASHADILSTESTNGKVEPVEDFQARSPAATIVTHVFVELNQHVARGTELLRVDDSDARRNVAAAQATLVAARAQLDNLLAQGTHDEGLTADAELATAKSNQQQAAAILASTQALSARGSASASELASARQRKDDADARVNQLLTRRKSRYSAEDIAVQRAQVQQAEAALSAARTVLGGVNVRAPFAGTIYSLPVSEHDYVAAGEALLNMADLSEIQVRAYFDEPEIGKLVVNQPVKIVWEAKPNQTWHGRVKQVPTTIISSYGGTRNVGECLITVDDAHGDLLPNTNVTVTVTTSQKKGVLSIPREALHTDPTHTFVYRVVNGHLQRAPVQVGTGVNNTRVEIVSGLQEGDSVALNTTGNGELKDGLTVKVTP